ncbi:c-type cytochrome [Devosia sp. PTR5]|uniref:C-type cytochrome n=1 Tax=Devosia oryzisoli TaxID=2774138 RepID=A0A927FU81_9HYPH|nr:c-type cytochrome [Devosia oryzisoli]MBD8066101.1 c-type cytochrome [Devosia oryzisoli]
MPEDKIVKDRRLTRWQRIGVASLLVLAAFMMGGVIFVASGVYNIGADRDHWSVTNLIITILRDRSIAAAAGDVKAPPLDDPDLYLLGEQHYVGGCATCHGTPGQPLNPIYRNMLPNPPDLTGAFSHYSAEELFWIVKNGLKFTGMPAWAGEGRSDEVWSVVAYLKQLHQTPLSGETRPEPTLPRQQEVRGLGTLPLENCVRCHGDAQTGPVSALVPTLQNLPQAYLKRALEEYRAGTRPSGIMEPVAYEMTDAEIEKLAEYYTGLPVEAPTDIAPGPLLEQGRRIAESGVPEHDLPACNSCHNGSSPQIPTLAGQSARYIANQLQLWRQPDYRDTPPYGSLMASIAQRVSEDDALAVGAYYASQPAGGTAPP